MSTPEENKAIVRRYLEEIPNKGNFEVADEVIHPAYRSHDGYADQPAGPSGVKMAFTRFRAGFPDLTFEIEDVMAEGDRVAARGVWRGTRVGPDGKLPSGAKPAIVPFIYWYIIQDGKVVEFWGRDDQLGLYRQLGDIPTPVQNG